MTLEREYLGRGEALLIRSVYVGVASPGRIILSAMVLGSSNLDGILNIDSRRLSYGSALSVLNEHKGTMIRINNNENASRVVMRTTRWVACCGCCFPLIVVVVESCTHEWSEVIVRC